MYDIERLNNTEHLTFGIGGHHCPAKSLSVSLTVEALSFLFRHYNQVSLIEKDIQYEPSINLRLPKNLFISL
jgi:cytochrome P450